MGDSLTKRNSVILRATDEGKGKRKRRRKQPPGTATFPTDSTVLPQPVDVENIEAVEETDEEDDVLEEMRQIADVANFKFKVDDISNPGK